MHFIRESLLKPECEEEIEEALLKEPVKVITSDGMVIVMETNFTYETDRDSSDRMMSALHEIAKLSSISGG